MNKVSSEYCYVEEKEKILNELHDGLGVIITNINMLAELALKESSEHGVKKILRNILDLSKEGLNETRTLMYSLDLNGKDWNTLKSDLRNIGVKMMESHNILFRMDSSIDNTNMQISSLIVLNLFRIYREALTNIIKHSNAKSVNIVFDINHSLIVLSIVDDGIGLRIGESNGRGILNMKKRAKDIGGNIIIKSDEGTSIKIEIPLS